MENTEEMLKEVPKGYLLEIISRGETYGYARWIVKKRYLFLITSSALLKKPQPMASMLKNLLETT